jgi:hypothetical protein
MENGYGQMLTLQSNFLLCVGGGSAVGIATRFTLDGTGIQSRWGRDSLHPSRPAVRPTQPPIQRIQLIPGVQLKSGPLTKP